MATIGFACLVLALAATVFSVGVLWVGDRLGEKRGESATNAGYIATLVAMGTLSLSILVLVVAFFRKDFTLLYVAENHSLDTSSLAWLFKLSSVWAGRAGSFLLWTWILALFAAFVAWKRLEITDRLSNMALMVTNVVLTLFSAAMVFSAANNPFARTGAAFLDAGNQLIGEAAAWGMNPLLQHWAMILHPPMLFIGYAGLTIPFAFAIAALIVNDSSSKWVDLSGRITVFAWLFLGAGIGLGAVWAYVVLGWGGYWGWDPVENASLLPWLTGVALLHSFTVYRRRGGFKMWAVMLSAGTFALVILGTFITRSGIVQSVHAFEQDNLSLWLFLLMIIGSMVAAIVGALMRRAEFSSDNDDFDSMASKDAAYYFNNVIMSVAGILVAYLTIASALPAWLPLGGLSIPTSTYDAVARPIGILYLMILTVCPLLSWSLTDKATFWRRIKWPLVGAAVLGAGLLAIFFTTLKPIYSAMVALGNDPGLIMAESGPAWYYQGLAIVGLLTASLLISTTVSLFISGARKRAESHKTGFLRALGSIFVKARSQSGGFLAHLGMGIILVGLIGSAMFVMDQTVVVSKSSPTFAVGDYEFTYQGSETATLASGAVQTQVGLQVTKSGKDIAVMKPGMTVLTNGQGTYDAKVFSRPLEDVFVSYQGGDATESTINVRINPLIWCVWAGFILMLAGTSLAVWPRRGAKLESVPTRGSKVAKGAKGKAKSAKHAPVQPAHKPKRPTKRS